MDSRRGTRVNVTQSKGTGRFSRSLLAIVAVIGLSAGSVAVAPAAAAGTRIGTPVVSPASAHVVAAKPASVKTASGYTTGTPRAFDLELIGYVNAARAKVGAPALKEAQGLTDMSVLWSRHMLGSSKKLEHNPKAWTQVTQYGAANRLAWGENVGRVQSASITAKQLFDAYMNSPSHRANILNAKYRYVGMGSFAKGQLLYNTMEFTDRVQSLTATKIVKPAKR